MHLPTDRIAHTTAFVIPVVEHWLEREIAQWVHPMKDRSDDPSHHERMLFPRSYISLPGRGRGLTCLCAPFNHQAIGWLQLKARTSHLLHYSTRHIIQTCKQKATTPLTIIIIIIKPDPLVVVLAVQIGLHIMALVYQLWSTGWKMLFSMSTKRDRSNEPSLPMAYIQSASKHGDQ